jgi:hypothetical protein
MALAIPLRVFNALNALRPKPIISTEAAHLAGWPTAKLKPIESGAPYLDFEMWAFAR